MKRSAEEVIEALGLATEENQREHFRSGQTVHLPAEGELWVSGDIHGQQWGGVGY